MNIKLILLILTIYCLNCTKYIIEERCIGGTEQIAVKDGIKIIKIDSAFNEMGCRQVILKVPIKFKDGQFNVH
jgi:hypothetical protein